MYNNVHSTIQNLRRPAIIRPGGLCRFYIAKHEDIAVWPPVDPANGGVINEAIELKVGGTFYIIECPRKDRSYREKMTVGPEGPGVETVVTCTLPGNTINNILTTNAMMHHKYVIIAEDTDGIMRLVGNEDAGCSFVFDFNSGDLSASRMRNLEFKWEHSLAAPVYQGGSLIIDITKIFTQLTKIDEFKVEAGAPMEDTDTLYTNNLLTNRNCMMFADGVYIPQVVNPGFRYSQKNFNSNQIFVNGGVNQNEIISIFIIS